MLGSWRPFLRQIEEVLKFGIALRRFAAEKSLCVLNAFSITLATATEENER